MAVFKPETRVKRWVARECEYEKQLEITKNVDIFLFV